MVGATGATASTVTLSAVEAALVIPATVSVAVKLWVALLSAAVVKLQAPLPSALAVPSRVAPSYTFTVLLASAVPVRVRTFTLVMPSPTVPLSGENEVMVGIGVFTVIAATDDAAPVVPAASVAVAVKLWAPLLSAAVVKLQAPVPLAVALPSSVAPS